MSGRFTRWRRAGCLSGMDARAGEASEQAGARGGRVIAAATSRYSRTDTCCFAPAAARLDERFGQLPA